MILKNLQLQNLEKKYKRNIITYPIIIANKTWGVINIEKMPFQKYNEYAETFIAIIIALSSSVLQKAID